jgi:hypothetical protein
MGTSSRLARKESKPGVGSKGAAGSSADGGHTLSFATARRFVSVLWLCYWVFVLYWLGAMLGERQRDVRGDAGHLAAAFRPYIWLIGITVAVRFLFQILIKDKGIDSFYPVCTKSEIRDASPGKGGGQRTRISQECVSREAAYNNYKGGQLTTRTYQYVQGLFLLVLFLFSSNAGRFRGRLANRNSLFVTRLIEQALLVALVLLSSPLFIGYHYLSAIAYVVYDSALAVLGGLVMLLLVFIFFQQVRLRAGEGGYI